MNSYQVSFNKLCEFSTIPFNQTSMERFLETVSSARNLAVVGSGASYVAADFIAKALNVSIGVVSFSLTARDFLYYNRTALQKVLLVSYSGSLRDFKTNQSALRNVGLLTVAKLSENSPIYDVFFAFDEWKRKKGFNIPEAVLIPCCFCAQTITGSTFDIISSLVYWRGYYSSLIKKKQYYNIAVFEGDFCSSAALDIKIKLEESTIGMAHLFEKRDFAHGKFISFDKYAYDYILFLCQYKLSQYEKELLSQVEDKFPDKLIVVQSRCNGIQASLDLLVSTQCFFNELSEINSYDFSNPPYNNSYLNLYKTNYIDY